VYKERLGGLAGYRSLVSVSPEGLGSRRRNLLAEMGQGGEKAGVGLVSW